MAINRADYLGSTFLYPEYQPRQMVQGGGGQPMGGQGHLDDKRLGLPEMAEGLQYTEQVSQLSKKYYQDYAALRGYANTLWKNYGIDVTRPDTSRPESIEAAETFNQALGNLAMMGDFLKQSQDVYKKREDQRIAGNYVMGDQSGYIPEALLGDEAAGYSTNLPEDFDLAKSNINRTVDTRGEQNRLFKAQDQFAAPYQQAAMANPNDPRSQFLANAAEQLSPVYNQPSTSDGGSGNTNAILNLANELSRLATGTHFSFKPSSKFNATGKPIREATPPGWVGSTLGNNPTTGQPFVIAKFEQDPDTGTVTAVAQDGSTQPIDPQNIDVTFRSYIDSNRGAFSRSDYDKFVKQVGLDPQGRLSANAFVPPAEMKQRDLLMSQEAGVAPKVQIARDNINKSVESLSEGGVFNSIANAVGLGQRTELVYGLPDGKEVLIKKDGNNYKIKNYQDIFGAPSKGKIMVNGKLVPVATVTKMSKQNLTSLLEDLGVLSIQLQDAEGNKADFKSPEQIKAQQLIEKYGKK